MQVEYNDGSMSEPTPFEIKKMYKELKKDTVKKVHVFNKGTCPVCGKTFESPKGSVQYYCSKECRKKRHNKNK